MAYLLGIKNFHALTLKIDARVLDPRDDTESLVEWALRVAPDTAPLKVLDLGTGSGAIALALAYSRPHWQVFASDLSADALNLARDNAQQLGLRVHWAQGDWWAPWGGQRFDLLVSGADGLDAIRQIIHRAGEHLSEGAWLLLEHGHDQAAAVRTLLSQAGFAGVTSERDLAGIERCSGGFWPCAKNVTA
jgi:release factor glutamine methyltransferase